MPPGVAIMCSPAMISVPGADGEAGRDAVHDVRVAGLADGDDAAVLDADVAFDDAEDGVEDDGAGDDGVGRRQR